MKKLLISLLAAALVSFALVAVSSSPAQADCPYTGCIATDTRVRDMTIRQGRTPTVHVRVVPRSGDGTVRGTVSVHCTSVRTGNKRHGSATLRGGEADVTMNRPFRALGRWNCVAVYHKRDPYKGSSERFTITVVRR